ncbi:MAG: hypothetical protein GY822_09455 [Deltaproteobacteria bacterium]|nr:hypothetical protein [Deltaproteobacteria bacterium]
MKRSLNSRQNTRRKTHPLVATLFLMLTSALFFTSSASAYTFDGGDLALKVNAGAGVNLLHADVATKRTPGAGMLFTLDVDYAITGPLHVIASVRPQASSNFVDLGVGAGIAYRVVQLEAPFVPYASAMVTPAFGVPFGHGDVHLNIGTRLGVGVDYFIMRQLFVGMELAVEGSLMAFPLLFPEITTEVLLGVGWRF